jgi:hypothetical protein
VIAFNPTARGQVLLTALECDEIPQPEQWRGST